ncbi:50S ribosomal protein L27 [Flavobacteriaceae bacterium 3519-10]|nr:50S ribosomal protein L27 [Flavobacteriaceae bacterium 3519-10]
MDYNIMLQAHRGFAYLILLAIAVFVVALVMTMFGYSGKITKLLRKSTLFTMIFFHTQALIGLIMLFFFSPGFKAATEAGILMKDSVARNTYVEHPFAMIVSAVLLTILNKKFKTNDKIQMSWVIMAVIALALMLWAFQWSRLFGA